MQQSPDGVPDGHAVPLSLLGDARAVLFDFDGPVCRLFGKPTSGIADEIKAMVLGREGSLNAEVGRSTDSHGVLRLLRQEMINEPVPGPRRQETLERAEAIVTRHELTAAATAEPEPRISELIELLRKLEKRLVIVSNNAEAPVREYLRRPDVALLGEFEAVFGRDTHELRHMKPHPHCVERALRYLELRPTDCVLIGDQMTDLEAAQRAGTPFLGYAPTKPSRADRMQQSGAGWAGTSLDPVIDAVQDLMNLN